MLTRTIRFLIAALFVGIIFLYPLLAQTPHRIDEAHLQMIRYGMTPEEVASIFGVDEGEYDGAESSMVPIILGRSNRFERKPVVIKLWVSRNGTFPVYFESGMVRSTGQLPVWRIHSPWERFVVWCKSASQLM